MLFFYLYVNISAIGSENMLQFLIIWITTILTSVGADISLAFKMIKDVADSGYKIKMDRMKEVSDALNPNVKQMNNFIKLIPIINLMKSFSDLVEYSKARNRVFDSLNVLDCVEEMTDEEKEQYMLKPTAFNAIVIYAKSKIKEEEKDEKITISFKDGNEEGKIIFKIIERNDKKDIFIISNEGIAESMTIEEQKSKIIETLQLIKDEVDERFDNYDDFKKEITKNNNSISLNNYDKKNDIVKDRKEQIDELNKFKKELLESKNNNEKIDNNNYQKRK